MIHKPIDSLTIFCEVYKTICILPEAKIEYMDFRGKVNQGFYVHSDIEKYASFDGEIIGGLTLLKGEINCTLHIGSKITGDLDLFCQVNKDLWLTGQYDGKIKTHDPDIADIAAHVKQGVEINLNDYRRGKIMESIRTENEKKIIRKSFENLKNIIPKVNEKTMPNSAIFMMSIKINLI